MIWRGTFKIRLLLCFLLLLFTVVLFARYIFQFKVTFRSLFDSTPYFYGREGTGRFLYNTKASTDFPTTMLTKIITTTEVVPNTKGTTDASVTLFVRMAGKLPEHRKRYYCDLFRTTVLFWPSSYGKILVLLDEESEEDHVFGDKILDQTKKYFPDYKLEVQYEALPEEKSTLDFPGMPQPPGYNRQLWSSFFVDLFTNDSIIAWMDNDAAFITPVTKFMIFTGTKLRILGSGCTQHRSWVPTWAETTELALGLPFVTDFMTYFPVYIYRDTFTRCREHILKRFSTSNFEEAFRKFYKGYISPVSIIMGYAWYFERDRYDWNFEICNGLSEYNKRFANGHNTIGPEDVETILSEPQATFHVPYAEFLSSNILVSYCLSQKAAGNDLDICSSRSKSLSDNFVLLNFDLQFVETVDETPCTGNHISTCLRVLERHYKQIGSEIKKGREVEWRNVEIVEKLANEFDIQCSSLT